MKTLILSIATVIGLAFLATPGMARPGMGMDFDPMERVERMAEHLDLNADQEERIAAILNTARTEGAADHERIRQIRDELKAQMENFDEGTAQSLADELGQITTRQTYERMSSMAQVYQVLTPEQREELAEFAEKRAERKGKWSRGHR